MIRRRRPDPRVTAILDALHDANIEPIGPTDLRTIALALDDRIRLHAGTPAGEAALHTRTKIAHLETITRKA